MSHLEKTTQPLPKADPFYDSSQTEEQDRFQKRLYEFNNHIRQSNDIDTILQMTLKEICEACGLPAASIHIRMPVTLSAQLNTRDLGSKDLQ